jgi:hypothetical protein
MLFALFISFELIKIKSSFTHIDGIFIHKSLLYMFDHVLDVAEKIVSLLILMFKLGFSF